MMNKTYKYRKFIKKIYKTVIYFFLPFSLLLFIFGLFVFDTFEELFFLSFPLLAFIVNYLLYRKLVSTFIRITDEGIEYQSGSRKLNINYREIASLDSKSIRYTGGWMLIKLLNDKPIRLAISLENIGDLALTLKNKLDELDLSGRYNEEKLFSFYKTSVFADHSWVRSRRFLPIFMLLLVLQSVFMSVMAGIFEEPSIIMIGFLFIIIGMIPYYYIEFGIYVKELRHLPFNSDWKVETPDPVLENKRIKFELFSIIVSACVSVIVILTILFA